MEEAKTTIYALRTTANREDQVMDFVSSNAKRKKLEVYSVIKPHGMRGYIFLEAASKTEFIIEVVVVLPWVPATATD